VVDAPVTEAMRRDEFERAYRDQYGRSGLEQLPSRLARAEKFGTSSLDGESLDDLILGNRAGPNEEEVSLAEILRLVGISK
jgi:hypothetical protein